ncbi:HDOD domain-containing protein [Niveibacterium terrae]|uniref:HDOD domain-containing protein n=1 Tax=Niveibacterium terrae TaxID=3373598 RepID=UPI003A92A4B4
MTTLEDVRRIGAAGLVAQIRERDMPAFGRTVASIGVLTGDDKASASSLAAIILQDAALTTKVLKLANSVYFNPARAHISTVSRALVVLGFDVIASIAVSLMLIDALLSGGLRERVVGEMGRAFHAAVQARTLAVLHGEANPEEVFISALLARVGEMAFWCFGDEAAQSLDTALATGVKPEVAESEVLGFRLRQISVGLAREWRLGSLLVNTLERGESGGDRESSVILAQQFAVAVESGWGSPQARQAIAKMARHTGRPESELTAVLLENAAAAVKTAATYGAVDAARMIPVPEAQAEVQAIEPEEVSGPDPLLQLKILRDLSMLLGGRPSLNDILTLALEGIFRGIGMDRALFALVSADRKKLVGRAALGHGATAFCQAFQFVLDASPGELINAVIVNQQALIIRTAFETPLRLDRLIRAGGMTPCMLAPIVIQGRAIGLFYADRVSGGEISEDDGLGFFHFAQQAALGFEHVMSRVSRP